MNQTTTFQISNELEFCLANTTAGRVLEENRRLERPLELVPEVNPRDIIEMNISLAGSADELNAGLEESVQRLIELTDSLNANIYAGSSLLSDVMNIEPRRYRTTSLSNACARGFLDITSQQIVLGVPNEVIGFRLYNFFCAINPILIALSASSPYTFSTGHLNDSRAQSRRMHQYSRLCSNFPDGMWKTPPELNSMMEYKSNLQSISDEVNRLLHSDRLDANWEELRRDRGEGKAYYPFERLLPHQIYWFVRPRPDHKNDRSAFSIELRVMDIPTTPARMQMINSFVYGLASYVAQNGTPEVGVSRSTFDDMLNASINGFEGSINGNSVRSIASSLLGYSEQGLLLQNQSTEPLELASAVISTSRNDAALIRLERFMSANALKNYLIDRLRNGE